MKLHRKQIAEAFSTGNFKLTYPYLSDHIKWHVINNFTCKGRKEVIAQCEKIAAYFASISTDFKEIDLIKSGTKVVITGTAELSKNGKRFELISACDVYEFDSENRLQSIASYCVIANENKGKSVEYT